MRAAATDNPLIVQSDLSVLLEVSNPRYEAARAALLRFAELVKAPEHVHTYRISPLSIWNARAAGMDARAILDELAEYARYAVPDNVAYLIRDQARRYGLLRLLRGDGGALRLLCAEPALAAELERDPAVAARLGPGSPARGYVVAPPNRGPLKLALIKAGWPVADAAGYDEGEPLMVSLRQATAAGEPFALRPYQADAVEAFQAAGLDSGGSGVVVLPCGAGKTIVGMACLAGTGASTLVLTTSVTAARQWIAELLDKTSLEPGQIGEYTGYAKDIRPVTVATYQMLTHRPDRSGGFPHFALFDARPWGLIVYDEVHLLPAPVFQVTAGLQARRRLGLTATLVREDGREDDVFALIGPKKTDVPWQELEEQGWIATAACTEVRVPLAAELRMPYALAPRREKHRVAAGNPAKLPVLRHILAAHPDEAALVIGTYVEELAQVASALDAPLLSGATSQKRRERLYQDFKAGRLPVLAVSKVANFAIDLPDAALLVQLSGSFGSRQEEAQRLGRILRPKPGANQAHFYTIVSRDTVEQDFALHRQLFLCEQGYQYRIVDAHELSRVLSSPPRPRHIGHA